MGRAVTAEGHDHATKAQQCGGSEEKFGFQMDIK